MLSAFHFISVCLKMRLKLVMSRKKSTEYSMGRANTQNSVTVQPISKANKPITQQPLVVENIN
jgi:hypothetical protein